MTRKRKIIHSVSKKDFEMYRISKSKRIMDSSDEDVPCFIPVQYSFSSDDEEENDTSMNYSLCVESINCKSNTVSSKNLGNRARQKKKC